MIGSGTKEAPITVEFASGRYDFFPQNAFASKFNISNTNDAPDTLKSVAFYLLNSRYINIKGHETEIIFRGKTMILGMNECSDIQNTYNNKIYLLLYSAWYKTSCSSLCSC